MSDTKTSPESCLRQFRAGETEALGELFDLAAPELFAIALTIALDAASAEDALQETFLVLLGSADRHDAGRPVMPWLVGILRMKLKESRRSTRRTPDPERLRPRLPPDDPLALASESELTGKAREAIERLSEPYRSVALLRWQYGLEPSEIAHVRGDPPGTVRSILHRALVRIRKGLPALPAFLLLSRPARGLDAVREVILAKSAVTIGSSLAGSALGGFLMSQKILSAFAVLLALLLLGAWVVSPDSPASLPPAPPKSEPIITADREVQVNAPRHSGVGGHDTASITGRFLHGKTLRPVPGVRIQLGSGPAAHGGTDGRFRIDDLSPGDRLVLRGSAEGLASYAATLPVLRLGRVTDLGDIFLGPPAGIEVRVVTTDSRPVVGATISVRRNILSRLPTRPRFPMRLHQSEPLVTAVTDESGRARVSGLAPGSYFVTAGAPGRARSRFEHTATGEAGELTVVLESGFPLDGVVRDSRGRPVGGAAVCGWRRHSAPTNLFPVQFWTETADESGRFSFDALPGRAMEIVARRPGGVFGALTRVAPAVRDRVELRLHEEGVVEGRAFDHATGKPVAGLDLLVTISGAEGLQATSMVTQTDRDGRFRAPGLALGADVFFHPVSDSEWMALHMYQASVSPAVKVGRVVAEVEVPLVRGGVIEGVVTGPGGEPVSDAEVFAIGEFRDWQMGSLITITARARSDTVGRFHLDGLGPGHVVLGARGGGLVTPGSLSNRELHEILEQGSRSPRTVEVRAGAVVRSEIRLAAGVSVSGRVLDAEGDPAAGARVFTWNRFIDCYPVGTTYADEKGSFRLEGLPETGGPIVIGVATVNGFVCSESLHPGPDLEISGVVLRLVPYAASISGVIETPQGVSAEGARLYVVGTGPGIPPFEIPTCAPTAVAADGSFRADSVYTGNTSRKVRLMAVASGWLPGVVEVEVRPGEHRQNVRVVLAAGASLRGSILNADGSPAAGIPVSVFVDPSGSSRPHLLPEPRAVTGESGEFTLTAVPPDTWLCLCIGSAGGRIQFERRVRAGPEPQVFSLDELVAVCGIVRGSEGTPARNVRVSLMGQGRLRDETHQAQTGPDGSFEFRHVPRAAFRLLFAAGEFQEHRTAPYAAGTDRIEVTLERGLTITGSVVGREGAPVARAEVAAFGGGVSPPRTQTAKDGTFRLRGLSEGSYSILVTTPTGLRVRKERVGAGARDVRIEVKAEEELEISGVVVDGGGRPVALAMVHLFRGGSIHGRTCGHDGKFTFAATEGETYVLEAAHAESGVAFLEGVTPGTRDLVLILGSAPRSAVRGIVLDDTGRPAAGVRVRALRMNAGVHRLVSEDMGRTSDLNPAEDVETRTSPNGEFELTDLLPGEWLLVAGERGKVPVTASGVVRTATDATPARLRVGGGWTLRARLLDEDGQPVAGVEVTVLAARILPFPAQPRHLRTRTDEDGLFEVEALTPGPAKVNYRDGQRTSHPFTVEMMKPGQKPAVLRLER